MKFLNTLEEVPLLQLYLSDTGTKTKGEPTHAYRVSLMLVLPPGEQIYEFCQSGGQDGSS